MAQPPSFYGQVPQTARLPMPIDASRPLAEGVDALSRAVTGAEESRRATDVAVRESDLRSREIERARDLQIRTGDAAAYLATATGELQTDLIKLREQAGPGAAGHEAAADQRIAAFREDVANHIGGDPELNARLVDNIAAAGASARVGEATWAAQQRALKSKDDYDTLDSTLGNNLRTAVTNGTFTAQMLEDSGKLREKALANLHLGPAGAVLLKQGRVTDVTNVAEAVIDKNPHLALRYLDEGHFDELPDNVRDALRTRARVAAEHLDNQADSAANAAAAQARATERNLIEDVNSGTMVDTAALQTALARAAASKKPEDISLAHDLTIAIAKNAVTAKYDTTPNADRRAAIAGIEGTKDWQRNEQLVAAHDQLGKLIDRDEHATQSDILSLYQRQTGQVPPPLNLGDPAAMRQRFLLGEAAGQRYGKPPAYLTEPEAAETRQNYNNGTPAQKADMLLGFGLYGSQRARSIMRQLSPNNAPLARLAELAASPEPAVKQLVREALDGGAQPVKDGTANRIQNLADSAQFAPALARVPGDRRKALLQVATWIYAHRTAAEGKGGAWDKDMAAASIEAALGAGGGKGGLGKARNGEATVLPTGISQSDFDGTWALANEQDIRNAANGVPKWVGRALGLAEFKQLTPMLVNDTGSQTLYAFRSRGSSGTVKNEAGLDYLVDVRAMARAYLARVHRR